MEGKKKNTSFISKVGQVLYYSNQRTINKKLSKTEYDKTIVLKW